MTVDDSVMQKLWKLTNELTAQLVFNRNATLELKQQLADLQVGNACTSAFLLFSAFLHSFQELTLTPFPKYDCYFLCYCLNLDIAFKKKGKDCPGSGRDRTRCINI